MYEVYYGLRSDPFRLLPDAGICFLHRSCAKAWAYLRYALKRGEGIVVVTGPPGSGKTTLAGRIMDEMNPATTVGVRIVADGSESIWLLRRLACAFGLPAEGVDHAVLVHRIERHLVELEGSHRLALVVIDEAQALSTQALEAMRLLTDRQSGSHPLLQLFLLGQTALEGVLRAPEMEPFQQRVIAGCRLQPMDLEETKAYIEYRLVQAGWVGDPSIDGPAVMAIFRYSKGMPRHVNKICSRLLLHGSAEERHVLRAPDVLAVVEDLREELLAPLDAAADDDVVPAESVGVALEALAVTPEAMSPVPADRASRDPMHNWLPSDDAPDTVHDMRASGPAAEHGPGRPRPRVESPSPERHGAVRRHADRREARDALEPLRRRASRAWQSVWGPQAAPARALSYGAVQARNLFERGRHWLLFSGARSAALSGTAAAIAVAIWFLLPSAPTPPASVAGAGDQAAGHNAIPSVARTRVSARLATLPESPAYLVTAGRVEGSVGVLHTTTSAELAAAPASAPPGDGKTLAPLLVAAAAAIDGDIAGEVSVGDLVDVDATVLAVLARDGSSDETLLREPEVGPAQVAPPSTEGSGENHVEAGVRRLAAGRPAFRQESARNFRLSAARPSTEQPAEGIDPSSQGDSPDALGDTVSAGEVGTGLAVRYASTAAADADQVVTADAERRARIRRLLALGDQALRHDRLTQPTATSAYHYYGHVLALEAGNARAAAGLARIVGRYYLLAEDALRDKAFDRSARYIARALLVQADAPRLLRLRSRLEDAIAQARAAELAVEQSTHVAAAKRDDSREPEVAPAPRPESNFRSLMRFVD